MPERRAWLLLSLSVSLSGCVLNQGLAPADPFGLVTSTIDEEIPEDLKPANIYEIDEQAVVYDKRTFRLVPGSHTFRVWPQGPPQVFVPDTAAIESGQVRVDAVTLEVEAGYRYFLAVRERTSRGVVTVTTEEGSETTYGEWEFTYEPVLVKVVPPADLERAAKGFGVFAGSLPIGPVLAPVAVGG